MKLICTKIRNIIGPADITRIAKACINIYHGRKLFEEDGTPVAGATLDNTPATYLEWEESGMIYNYIPVRAFIYVNFKAGIYDALFKCSTVCNQILADFQFYNRWGWRTEIYTDHVTGTSQFTIEKYDAELYTAGSDICFTAGEPFHTKNNKYKFVFIISDKSSLFQYSAPGKFPKPYNLAASLVTIVVDVAHVTELKDGFQCTGFPPLLEDITVVARTINLSRRVGVEAHIYTLMGGPCPGSKCWSGGHLKIVSDLERRALWVEGTKVHKVSSLAGVNAAKGDATASGTCCTVCGVEVFDKYYQVQHTIINVVVCKFCAHWNSATNLEMNSGRYLIAVATSTTTAASLVEIVNATVHERDVMRHLLQQQAKGSLTHTISSEFAVMNKCSMGSIVTKMGNTTIIGTQSCKEYQDMLEQIHLFPDHTRVFEYNICFD